MGYSCCTGNNFPAEKCVDAFDLSKKELLISCLAELFGAGDASPEGEVVKSIWVGAKLISLHEPAGYPGGFINVVEIH